MNHYRALEEELHELHRDKVRIMNSENCISIHWRSISVYRREYLIMKQYHYIYVVEEQGRISKKLINKFDTKIPRHR